jgi:hypothetical protein
MRRVVGVFALVLAGAGGCSPIGDAPPKERTPVRWQLVERSYQDCAHLITAGDGRVDPEAVVLAFEPVYPEDLEAARPAVARLSVEIVELLPDREAGLGQPVAATVRVANADPRARYRLRVEALDPRVRILGDRLRTVKGPESATFRFTSGTLGRRGISVDVEEVD